MIELLLMYVLSRFNGVRARRKGYVFGKYFWRSVLFFFIGEVLGVFLVMFMLYNKGVNIADQKEVMAVLTNNYQYQLIAMATGVGGILWIWNQIDKLPPNKSQNPFNEQL